MTPKAIGSEDRSVVGSARAVREPAVKSEDYSRQNANQQFSERLSKLLTQQPFKGPFSFYTFSINSQLKINNRNLHLASKLLGA